MAWLVYSMIGSDLEGEALPKILEFRLGSAVFTQGSQQWMSERLVIRGCVARHL